MSELMPEAGDVWKVKKSSNCRNIVIDTSDCRGFIGYIHCYYKPTGELVTLVRITESEYFYKNCEYLGKTKASIYELFEAQNANKENKIDDRARFDDLAEFMDDHEFTVSDFLACVCANLSKYQEKNFETELLVAGYKFKIRIDRK